MSEHAPKAHATDDDGHAPLDPVRPVSAYTDGGHEVDQPPSMVLMGWLATLALLVVGASIFVFQLFVTEADRVTDKAAHAVDPVLAEVRAEDEELRTTFGRVTREDEHVAYRIPIDAPDQPIDARRLVLEDPSRFAAAPAPEGWVHPDDADASAAGGAGDEGGDERDDTPERGADGADDDDTHPDQ